MKSQEAKEILRRQLERDRLLERINRERMERDTMSTIERLEERYPSKTGLGCLAAIAFIAALWVLVILLSVN